MRAAGLGLSLGAFVLAAQVWLLGGRGPGLLRPSPGAGPPGRAPARQVRAESLSAFDRSRAYRVRASDTVVLAPMWDVMAETGPKLLHVSNFQPYIDSIPELRKQQDDCRGPPDEEYYNRFTRYIPHMGTRGDKSFVEGLEPGMQIRDAHVRMYDVRTPMPRLLRDHQQSITRILNLDPDSQGRVTHAGEMVALEATLQWWRQQGLRDGPHALQNSGDFYYPPKGFKEWHTNKCQQEASKVYVEGTDDPAFDSSTDCRGRRSTGGWRGYLVYAAEDDKSWMSLVDTAGRIRSVPDVSGSLNLFHLGHGDEHKTWHAIYSDTHRWSVGFRIDEDWLNEVLLTQLGRDGALVEEIRLDDGDGEGRARGRVGEDDYDNVVE